MSKETSAERFQRLVREYRKSGMTWPATARDIALWALREGRIVRPTEEALVAKSAEQIAKAMREEFFTDDKGRSVRAKHAAKVGARGQMRMLWDDIRTGSPEHLAIAFQLRRQQIVGDCKQLKVDVDWFNEYRTPPQPVQLVLDFTDDVLEQEMLDEAA